MNLFKFVNRVTIKQKLIGLGVLYVLAVALPTCLYGREALKLVQVSATEQTALPRVQLMLAVIQRTQQHLALSTHFLTDGMLPKQIERKKAENVEESIVDYEDYLNKIHDAKTYKTLEALTNDWHKISQHVVGREMTAEQNFQQHASLAKLELNHLQNILDTYQLSVEQDANIHFFVSAVFVDLPQLTESMGLLRAQAVGLLAKGNATFAERAELKALVYISKEKIDNLDVAMTKAIAINKPGQVVMTDNYRVLRENHKKIINLIQEEILSKENFTYSVDGFYTEATNHIDSYFNYSTFAIKQVQSLLQNRVDQKKNRFHWWLFCVVVWSALVGTCLWRFARKCLESLPVNNQSSV